MEASEIKINKIAYKNSHKIKRKVTFKSKNNKICNKFNGNKASMLIKLPLTNKNNNNAKYKAHLL